MGSREKAILTLIEGEEFFEPRKKTRAEKKPRQSNRAEEGYGVRAFEPTIWQQEALDVIEQHDITFIDSVAGTGKTTTALYYACKEYLADVHKQIVFVRTPAEVGPDRIGFLPGSAKTDSENKLGPHFESTKAIMQDFIGKNKMDADEGKRIFFSIPNFELGKTRENSIYVLDECQLLQPLILKLLLERIGHGTKTIVLGSSGQLYTTDRGRNGLRDAYARFFTPEMEKKYERIGFYKFPLDAIQRADVVRDVIEAYEND
ncbi:MAG: PhoH-like protein [Myoviridae sp. ctThM1]|nr:MAG: PhoH-like protein [Myoviridae sp. ctThM1]